MVSGGNSLGLEEKDIDFTLSVLRDARDLDYSPKELKGRERAVRAILVGRTSEVWKVDEKRYGMSQDVVDPLFKRKKWNQIDSGFRLWGGGREKSIKKAASKDEFLESHSWNDMNSGFRIL